MNRNTHAIEEWGRIAALGMLATILFAQTAWADVGRIREMTAELELKLAKNRYEADVRVEKPNTARIYKDYDFILKKNKVDEVAGAIGTDPEAEHLRLYLIESIVNAELASFVDELRDFEQKGTATLDGKEVAYSELLKKLAASGDDNERRRIAASLPPLIETSAVFRGEILKRRNELYQPWGFDHYADFYAQKEGIDLDAIGEMAEAFIDESQALYDSLYAIVAPRYLNLEARKVGFTSSFPYLAQGTFFEAAFPKDESLRRMRGLFRGLGFDVAERPSLDREPRPGKVVDSAVYPVLVPSDVTVSVNPVGAGVRDEDREAYAIGEALIYTLSQQTKFELAYLVNRPAQEALAWLPRFVLDEPGWIAANVSAPDFNESEYLTFRAFLSLYEARMLASISVFEIHAYKGGENLDKEFRRLMKTATGARVSTSDVARAMEYITQFRATSRFYGLMVASGVRQCLRETLGDDWYADGKSKTLLSKLWKQGGALTVAAIEESCPRDAADQTFLASISAMLAHE